MQKQAPTAIIEHDGDTWKILSYGITRDDGKVFAHLASMTRHTTTKNGAYPAQMNDWVNLPATEA